MDDTKGNLLFFTRIFGRQSLNLLISVEFYFYCKPKYFSDLKIIAIIATGRNLAIKVEHYIFYSSLCYIQSGKKPLKILG